MRGGLLLFLTCTLACGPPKPPAAAERLRDDDLINHEMCVQMYDWAFDLYKDAIPGEAFRAREKLREYRAKLLSDNALEECTQTVAKQQYRCVMAARKYYAVNGCLSLERRGMEEPATLEPITEPWVAVTSDHFLLWTDLPAEEAVVLARRLEDLRAALVAIVAVGDTGQRSRVIAVGTHKAWRRYSGEAIGTLGGTLPAWASLLREPLLLLSPGRGKIGADVVAAHELVHLVTMSVLGNQPRWYAEGMASLYETVLIDRAKGEAFVGDVPPQIRETLENKGGAPIALLLSGRLDEVRDHRYAPDVYASSYLLVAYLYAQHRAELARFETLLRTISPKEHAQAFWRTFPSLNPKTIDRTVATWWVRGGHAPFRVPVSPATAVNVEARPMADADVYVARALLYGTLSHNRRNPAVINAEAALAAEPQHVLAYGLWIGMSLRKADPEAARALTRAHPDDWMAWLMLVVALPPDSAEATTAQAELCKRVASHPAVVLPERTCPP